MPIPKKGEKKKDYISRCIPEVIGEGKPPKEAAGKCYGMFDYYKGKKGKKGKNGKKKKGKKNESMKVPTFSEFIKNS